jgi:hypothetical protein
MIHVAHATESMPAVLLNVAKASVQKKRMMEPIIGYERIGVTTVSEDHQDAEDR